MGAVAKHRELVEILPRPLGVAQGKNHSLSFEYLLSECENSLLGIESDNVAN